VTAGRIRAVAFDLDGTLIDSRRDLAEAVNRVRVGFGHEPLAIETILAMVGRGARILVSQALGGDPEPALLERAVGAFYHHYDDVCLDSTVPFPGIDALLAKLGSGDRPLAVLTNKPERFARKIVDHLGWSARFRAVVGGDSGPTRKPDPSGFRSLSVQLGVEVCELLMVGDSRVDAETARAAGAPFIFVEWGYALPDERTELALERRVRSAGDLLLEIIGRR
jgi:phosphoglycolate phosphatase